MMRKITYSLILLVAFACERTKIIKRGEAAVLNPNEPELVFKQLSTFYSEDTQVIFKIIAETQLKYPNGDERFPDGIRVEMFSKTGVKKSILVADSGRYNFDEKLYTVMGNVKVKNLLEAQTLESDLLNWNKESKEVYTNTSVKIIDDCQITTGKGLKANEDFSEYEILEPEGSAPAEGC